jgi:probable rRNA maturation factor
VSDASSSSVPLVHVQNRQRRVRFDVRWLRRFAKLSANQCIGFSADGAFALRSLMEVEIAVVSDRVIARVHEQFMSIPGATDVITFAHGEIVMSAETARLYAAEHGHSLEQELGLYTIHGLLHLNGFEDAEPRDAARMHEVQSHVLATCLEQLPAP